MRIGFIGLGNMGGGMAANLVASGHDVTAFDLDADARARAETAGCRGVSNPAHAVIDAEAIITMLPNGAIVADVCHQTVWPHAGAGTLLIDCSTIEVATARALIAEAASHGLAAVDAPVSGGIAAANAGTLTFMVGGTDAAFARAQPVLAAMGKAVIHAGEAGAGQAAKICNNMLLGATMIATCESFALAERLGLDLQRFYDIASVSSGQSWSMTSYCPVPGVGPETPADRDYQGGFATALMLKDLRLAMAAARTVAADVPMGARAAELYTRFAESGQGARDFSAIIETMREKGLPRN